MPYKSMNMAEKNTLYPLKFYPIIKERIWGGNKLHTVLGKEIPAESPSGESWEISGVENDVSVVKGGTLEGKSLTELIQTYKGKLVGEKVYKQFGDQLPLLIKFLDAQEDLSIQVHPHDELAKERHNSFGKTEMWYVIQADEGSSVRSGFNRHIDKDIYLQHLEARKLDDILNIVAVQPDDVIFLPAGRVHSIGKGLLIAEIQQTSDITYRVYDFDRKDKHGQTRELHTEQAVDAIDYNHYPDVKAAYTRQSNGVSELAYCQYFATNLLHFHQPFQRNYAGIDSFIVLMGMEGSIRLTHENGETTISKGETVLLPAAIKHIELIPSGTAKLLESYMKCLVVISIWVGFVVQTSFCLGQQMDQIYLGISPDSLQHNHQLILKNDSVLELSMLPRHMTGSFTMTFIYTRNSGVVNIDKQLPEPADKFGVDQNWIEPI
jgi:mannose-6-phosphate isomerase